MTTVLVIGNKNYSSWSLRPWLVLRKSGLRFTEHRIPLDVPGFKATVAQYSPAGRVPVLHHEGLAVWDSLAISEFVAELQPAARLWPPDTHHRAHARAISAEMHSGFPALRSALPMNCRATGRVVATSPEVERDISRIQEIWRDCRSKAAAGPWLFGHFTIADAMFAPVVSRFHTYGVLSEGVVAAYCSHVLADPDVTAWYQAAREETEIVPADEAGASARTP